MWFHEGWDFSVLFTTFPPAIRSEPSMKYTLNENLLNTQTGLQWAGPATMIMSNKKKKKKKCDLVFFCSGATDNELLSVTWTGHWPTLDHCIKSIPFLFLLIISNPKIFGLKFHKPLLIFFLTRWRWRGGGGGEGRKEEEEKEKDKKKEEEGGEGEKKVVTMKEEEGEEKEEKNKKKVVHFRLSLVGS